MDEWEVFTKEADMSKDVERVVKTMGEAVAWGQLRSSGRKGSAVADRLMAFAARQGWRKQLVAYAEAYSQVVDADWRTFSQWWEKEKKKPTSSAQHKRGRKK